MNKTLIGAVIGLGISSTASAENTQMNVQSGEYNCQVKIEGNITRTQVEYLLNWINLSTEPIRTRPYTLWWLPWWERYLLQMTRDGWIVAKCNK